tara:strand:+ start:1180 stop:1944 length:765 start_codon:yes stop_codon:yes gene_type:complete
MFEGSTITKANPANFSFEVPLTAEKDESIVITLLSDLTDAQLKSFDLYVQTGSSTFKIENAVITNADFAFATREQFSVAISGQGTKLTRAGNESYTIPGSLQSESSTRTPQTIYPVVTIDSLDMSSILSANVSISTEISWTKYDNLHDSLSVTNSSNAMFPSTYTIGKRIASGAITQYQNDNNITQFDDFNTSSNLILKAVETGKASSDSGFFQLQLNPVSYTARMGVAEVYTQSYDFTSTDNTAISTRITQYS